MKWPAAVMLPPEPDAVLDRFASLAASTLRSPMAVLSLLSSDREIVLPGASGMPAPWQQERVMAWAHSLCRHAAASAELVVVDDVRTDPHAQDYREAVGHFGVGAWIAAPLRFSSDFTRLFTTDEADTPGGRTSPRPPPGASPGPGTASSGRSGAGPTDAGTTAEADTVATDDVSVGREREQDRLLQTLDNLWSDTEPGYGTPEEDQHPDGGGEPVVWGVLCVMDTVARRWSERDRELLQDLAAAAAAELRSRVLTSRAVAAERQMATALAASTAVHTRSQLLLSLSRGLSQAETVVDVSDILTALLRGQLGVDHFGLLIHEVEQRQARYVDMSTFPPGTDPAWAQFDLRTATAPAARAVADGVSFFCDDRDAVLATDPQLAAQGVWDFPGAVVIVPLLAGARHRGQRTLGALVLVWPTPRDTSDPADQALWTALADYTAQTLARVVNATQRRAGAEQLQRSMLTALPEPDHLEIRARYVPAARGEEVGGDWYDAVLSPDGATTLVIGDVTGHDMAAAAQMGQLRSVLRTLVDAFDESPAALLDRLEPANQRLGVHALATAVVARIEQDPDQDVAAGGRGWRRLRWSNAGHPCPVLLHRDGRTEALQTDNDLLLGLNTGHPRHDHVHDLPPGSLLLLYTDGLVEHRGRSLDDGLAELRRVLSQHADVPVTDLLDVLQRELIGPDPEDDCAVLAIRMHPEDRPRPTEAGPQHTDIPPLQPTADPPAFPAAGLVPEPSAPGLEPHGDETRPAGTVGLLDARSTELVLDPDPAAVARARFFVHDFCCRLPACGDICDTLQLLVSEVVTNAFLHGRSQARLQVTATATSLRLEVSDDNSALPALSAADPDALGGRGMALIEALTSAWGVREDPVGKTVWLELTSEAEEV